MLPRLRQAVLAARDLDDVCAQLRSKLGLADPYRDPGVERFGLRNAVFALEDTFLEVVSPIDPDASASRLLERRGGDTGYMLMFQVEDLEAARARARAAGVREVFDVSLDGMTEVHLHPADVRGAILALSLPQPSESWLWGGPNPKERAAPYRLTGATITVSQPVSAADRWQSVLGSELFNVGLHVSADEFDRGLTEIFLAADQEHVPEQQGPLMIGGVWFVFEPREAEEERRSPSVFEPETQ